MPKAKFFNNKERQVDLASSSATQFDVSGPAEQKAKATKQVVPNRAKPRKSTGKDPSNAPSAVRIRSLSAISAISLGVALFAVIFAISTSMQGSNLNAGSASLTTNMAASGAGFGSGAAGGSVAGGSAAGGASAQQSLASVLPKEKQAVSINVDSATGLSSLLRVGDYVRVLDSLGSSDGTISINELAPRSKVIALDSNMQSAVTAEDLKNTNEKLDANAKADPSVYGDQEELFYTTVSLEVSADEASNIRQAQNGGHLSLVLLSDKSEGASANAPATEEHGQDE